MERGSSWPGNLISVQWKDLIRKMQHACIGSIWFSAQHVFPVALSWENLAFLGTSHLLDSGGETHSESRSVSTQRFPGSCYGFWVDWVLNWPHQTKWKPCAPWLGEQLFPSLSMRANMETRLAGCCWQPLFSHANRPSPHKAGKLRL